MRSRLALLIGSTALVLLALEAGLRVLERATAVDFFHVMQETEGSADTSALRVRDLIRLSEDPELMYELDPRVVGRFKGAPVDINADGFRGPRIPLRRADPDALRIAGVGDSVTFGWGVAEPESFLGRIRAALDPGPGGAGPPVETLNLGVPGYNTHQEVHAFATRALAYRPDLALVLFVENDERLPNWFHHRRSLLTPRRSYLYDFLEVRVKRLLRGEDYRNRYLPRGLAALRDLRPPFDLGEERPDVPEALEHMVGPAAVDRALRRLASLAAASDTDVVFSWQAPAGPATRRAAAIAAELGFRIVDMDRHLAAYLERTGVDASALRVADDDPHPNARYHALMAEVLLERALAPWAASRAASGGAPRAEPATGTGS